MKNQTKIYLYAGALVVSAVAAYFVITNKKAKQKALSNVIDPDVDTVVTNTGQTISVSQATIPAELSKILKLSITEVAKLIGNKTIYAKVDNVNARVQPKVNNGWWMDNIWGVVSKDVMLGKIIAVAEDSNKAKNPEGRIYKWLKVELSPAAKESIRQNPNNKLGSNATFAVPAYFREDTILIK